MSTKQHQLLSLTSFVYLNHRQYTKAESIDSAAMQFPAVSHLRNGHCFRSTAYVASSLSQITEMLTLAARSRFP